jgi:hypothetical protein
MPNQRKISQRNTTNSKTQLYYVEVYKHITAFSTLDVLFKGKFGLQVEVLRVYYNEFLSRIPRLEVYYNGKQVRKALQSIETAREAKAIGLYT